jgi:hypothetical protein
MDSKLRSLTSVALAMVSALALVAIEAGTAFAGRGWP